ncbi:MAG TPA: SDR family oxidoreductase [Candidatus Woesebacteria bacterium]|nr:SDR family oxidoreductase [Candidatus Woesebacteria bacterium]
MSVSPPTVLLTGSSGLVASHFVELFTTKYQFEKLDISNPSHPVDITNGEQLFSAVANSKAEFLVHFAAFTDVTKAWEETNNKNGLCYKVNVLGTKNIVAACEKSGKHLIHISTAYVFDGENPNPYTESDQPHPIEWYGQTKWEAEQLVSAAQCPWTILRIDQPFGSLAHAKKDVLHKLVDKMKTNTLPPQFTNHRFGPTFIDDFTKVIDWVIRTKTTGLFHASSGESWTDFEFAQEIQQLHQLPGLISPGDLDQYLKTTSRPYQKNTALNCTKLIEKLDFKFQPIAAAIGQIKV